MRKSHLLILAVSGIAAAQQVVAPTPEPVGPAGGQDAGDYNVTNSFETGYRFAEVGGDIGKYRSDVNFRNGLRLLGSSLSIDSKDGHGRFFDQILLNTTGLGNDPYESATLRIQKDSLYRYDMMWRMDEFYNPALTISAGVHLMDTRRRLQDHDVTVLPQSRFRFRAGYSRNTQTGPALSSLQEFDSQGNAFPVFTDIRREWNEYRLGMEAELAGFKFTVLHRWDFYKDDSPYARPAYLIPPLAPAASVDLSRFQRSEPYHGSNPGWLGDLVTNRKHWALNARMTYTGGRRDFALDEAATGLNFGLAANRQILVTGNADRPVLAGDFSVSLFPTDRLTIVNNTSVHNARTVGDSNYTEFSNITGQFATLNFRYLGVRTLANSTDLNFRLTPWFGFYAGYQYSDRLITTTEGFATPGTDFENATYERNNHLNVGTLGVRIRPVKPLSINLEGEVGRDNRPLTPISDRNYHTIGGRVEYRVKQLQLSATYRQIYNVNAPVSLSVFSSHSRNYAANASWAPKSWLSFDASYMKLHLDTVSGLVFFAGVGRPQLQQTPTIYVSNIHAANLGTHFGLGKRVDLYAGYSITRDVGDGRATAVPSGTTDPVQSLLASVETFPLSFQSPLARLSIRLSPKVRWNAGWQFYNYHEEFGVLSYVQNYHANTGYTSVLWSF